MHRRECLAAVGTVGTIGVAGCTGSDETDDPNEENDDPEASETESSLETFTFPEHTSRDGVSANDLTTAHFDTLRSEGSVTRSRSTEYTTENTTFESNEEVKISTGGILRIEKTGDMTTVLWTEHGTDRGLIKRSSGFQTVYQLTESGMGERRALSQDEVTSFVQSVEFGEATDVVEIDGTLTARYEVTDVSGSSDQSRFGSDNTTVTSGSIFVTEDGIVKRIQYSLTSEFDGTEQKETVELTYSGIGSTSVSEPDWAETAREEGRAFDVSVTDDGYLSFELTNGDPVPEGTQLSFPTMDTRTEATLSGSVAVGDRLLVAVANDISVEINEKPAAESGFDDTFVSFSLRNDGTTLYEEDVDFYER